MTLVECLIALTILATATLAISLTLNASHQHQQSSERSLRAIRLAENLMEEILARPYSGTGLNRATYHVDNYDGFEEHAGQLRDFEDHFYVDRDQEFDRAASVSPSTLTIASLGNAVIEAKLITITVRHRTGEEWRFTRLIPAPISS